MGGMLRLAWQCCLKSFKSRKVTSGVHNYFWYTWCFNEDNLIHRSVGHFISSVGHFISFYCACACVNILINFFVIVFRYSILDFLSYLPFSILFLTSWSCLDGKLNFFCVVVMLTLFLLLFSWLVVYHDRYAWTGYPDAVSCNFSARTL